VWVSGGGYLVVSDPNANRIYKYGQAAERLTVYRENSGYNGADIAEYRQPGSNGLTLDARGRLTLDQHGNRREVCIEPDGSETTLADHGLWILSPSGRHLGTLRSGRLPQNMAWGGEDGKTLYLAAQSGLYRVRLQVAGIRP
jgi:sugar lactone lactonase YvrE